MTNAPLLNTSARRAHEWLHDIGRRGRMEARQIDHAVDALPKQVRELWRIARQ